MQQKKVVVTGGAGFIGSHLVEGLAGRGYQTIILDDLSTGKLENISGLLTDSTLFMRGSVTDLPLLKSLCKGVDYVFHLAAVSSVPRSIDNPEASHQVNVNGTLNVLLAAREGNVGKVIYASTAAVYGDMPALPKTEDMMPSPLSPYAVTKLTGEYYCRVFHQGYRLPTVCLRYFNVYGPRQDPESAYAAVVPRFIKRVTAGNPPVIFGDGEQTRDFCFVKDAVRANVLAAESDASGVFNIASGQSVTVNELARLVIELVGRPVEPVHEAARPGDIKHSRADVSRARSFGYQPQYDLKAGLTETIGWFNGK